jgi:hypothetical protein
METKPHTKTNTTESRNENLTCWRTATNPQCLRVETTSEIYLFPYGYFRRAKLSREGNKDTVEIQFQDTIVIAKGKGLEPLGDALARLGVERIRMCPEKYGAGTKESVIIEIEIGRNSKDSPVI